MDSSEKAILKTLLYADIFDFPLTEEEIYKYLISENKVSREEITRVLKSNKLPIETSKHYFYLRDKKKLVEEREKKRIASARKLKIAKGIIQKISLTPTIQFIGISGALSMENSNKDDDIDLFVVTQENFVWATRLLLVILLTVFGVYRSRKTKNTSDKICLNMILDKSNIAFGKKDQDLYTAHEIVQLLPIFDKGKTYEEFIKKNAWVNKFVPNFSITKNYKEYKNGFYDNLLIFLFRVLFLEKIAKFTQLNYMKNHRTSEVIKDGFLKFHPFDYKAYVLRNYKRKIDKFKL